jgi:ribosomal protein S18 acetylase RimI-like enzyme
MEPNSSRNSVCIRAVEIGEAERLAALGASTFYETFAAGNDEGAMRTYLEQAFSVARMEAELAQPESAFYFAFTGAAEEPVGYLKINVGVAQTEEMGAEALEIERLYVRGEHHGSGVGAALMERALEEAAKRGKSMVWLGVWEQNHRAVAFYRRSGFEVTGTHIFQFGEEAQTDWIMKRSV